MSEITNFYSSWLGGNSFGTISSAPTQPRAKLFTPLDISDCAIWFNCDNLGTIEVDDIGVVQAIDNLGFAGSAALKNTGDVKVVQDVNNLNCLNMTGGAFLSFTTILPYTSRTTFVVYKITSDIASDPYPYANFFVGGFAYEGLGIAAWMGDGNYRWQMAVSGVDYALDGYTDQYTVFNEPQYASFRKDYADLSNNFIKINNGPNIYMLGTPAEFFTGSSTYVMNPSAGNTSMILCEIIEYGRSLSDSEVTSVHNYIEAKWGFGPKPVPPESVPPLEKEIEIPK